MFGSDGIPDWGIAYEPGGFDRALESFGGSGPGRLRYVGLESEPRGGGRTIPSGVPDEQERIG